jgi:hypothetical protein
MTTRIAALEKSGPSSVDGVKGFGILGRRH